MAALPCAAYAGGEAFANGEKFEAGKVLTASVGPSSGACTVTITWSNAGLHLSNKVIAYAMEYTGVGAGGSAASAGGAGGK